MKSKRTERSSSILGDEELELEQALPQEEKEKSEKLTAEERKKLLSSMLPIVASLLAVIAVFVVGAIYAGIVQKRSAAYEPREDTPIFTASLEDAELKDNDISWVIEQAYYTAENGLMVTVAFNNDMETDKHIDHIVMTIHNKDNALLAKATSGKMDLVVAAGGTNEVIVYVEPEYVSITNDLLEVLTYSIVICE